MSDYDSLVLPEHGSPKCGELDADTLRIDDDKQRPAATFTKYNFT